MSKHKYIPAIYLFLTVITLAAFLQVIHHEFVYFDDNVYVTENPHIQSGITLRGISWAFTTGHAANWHPLTWISHMLDIQLFGLNPQWHHLTNLLFHITNVLLLFFVLHRMTKALWQSAFVAALFALHPLHVESVAWIAERKDVLSTFFWMLTLIAYAYYAERPRVKNYLAVIAFFALGLMAKPMVVTLPFVLLLLDYWPLERFAESKPVQAIRAEVNRPVSVRKRKGKTAKLTPKTVAEMEKPATHEFKWALLRPLVLEKIPLFALAALSCAATYIAQNKGGAVAPSEAYTLDIRLANALVSYLIYITRMIWPDDLAVLYPHPGFLPFWQVLGAILFLVAITLAVIRTSKRSPYLPVGWLWFTGTLVPVIGIVQVGSQAMADRYTYIPSIGLFIMAAWGIPEIFRKRRYAKEVLAASSALCLLCFFILTSIQVGYWRDSFILFEHTLEATRNNFPVLNSRGLNYRASGNHASAIEDFDRALEINPKYKQAFNNRGLVYEDLGNHTRAIADFDRAIEIDPEFAPAYNNRGNARDSLGNHARAIEDFDKAVEIDPGYAEAFNNRGIAYDGMGNYTRAVEDFGRAIEINPGYAGAYFNRGRAHAFVGNQKQALEDLKTAARLGYDNAANFLRSQGINW